MNVRKAINDKHKGWPSRRERQGERGGGMERGRVDRRRGGDRCNTHTHCQQNGRTDTEAQPYRRGKTTRRHKEWNHWSSSHYIAVFRYIACRMFVSLFHVRSQSIVSTTVMTVTVPSLLSSLPLHRISPLLECNTTHRAVYDYTTVERGIYQSDALLWPAIIH